MISIATEVVIPFGEHKTVYSSCRAVIRVDDNAAGPFLMIQGIDDDPAEKEEWRSHSFPLQSADEIDAFAELCKSVLRQAEMANGS